MKMQNNSLSVIIINYRQINLLFDCIKSVYDAFAGNSFEVIIINNSPEENPDKLSADYPGIKIINNENKGFSQANNLGVKISTGEYLLFLNCDTIVKNNFFPDLIKEFGNNDFGAAGLKLFYPDGSFQLSFWRENTFFNEIKNKKEEKYFYGRLKNYASKVENEFNKVKEVDWVSGAALFMRRKVFEKISGFDESFFLFYEDADLCKRLKSSGYKIYFFPYSRIIHYKGENINPDFQKSTYYYSKKSQLYYYKKHNNLFNKLMLRFYLLLKFGLLALLHPGSIYWKIFKLTMGVGND